MDTKWLLYTFLGKIADALDIILTMVESDKKPQRSIFVTHIDSLSDEEILQLTQNAPKLLPYGDCRVYELTPNTVATLSLNLGNNTIDAVEANALNLVFSKTTIPVPRVRRVLVHGYDTWIIMNKIPGLTLAEIWSSFSTWRKMWIAFTLRRYVRQLRRIDMSPTTPPGPLSLHEKAYKFESPIFSSVIPKRGPFTSYSELSAFFNERHKMTIRVENPPPDDPIRNEFFDNSKPLASTHQNINLHNLILGEDGRLWMIDWMSAAYLPRHIEYSTMLIQNYGEWLSGTNDEFWTTLIPFICGPYFRQHRWYGWIAESLVYKRAD